MTDKPKKKTGPKEDRVKLDIPWEDAVKIALDKERPKEGWPPPAIKFSKRKKPG